LGDWEVLDVRQRGAWRARCVCHVGRHVGEFVFCSSVIAGVVVGGSVTKMRRN
jgi:hypothetical protein